jgi:hypothetical protein
MAIEFTADAKGRSQIVITGEPNYVVPLKIAPDSLEEFLTTGKWLCVSISVWSLQDIRAGERAIELIKKLRGPVNLGLRPYDFPQENESWVYGLAHIGHREQSIVESKSHQGKVVAAIMGRTELSPIWVSLVNGHVAKAKFGLLSDPDIESLIRELASTSAHNETPQRHEAK